MAMGRPKAVLVLSSEQRAQLESMAKARSLSAGLVTRVRIVLLSANEPTNCSAIGTEQRDSGQMATTLRGAGRGGTAGRVAPRLYLNPPENAVVLCVDEKSQIQALERTQPMLPMGPGYVEGVTHDYRRHGTTTLFAALDTLKGTMLTQCRRHHRHQEYLNFLRQIEKNVPADLEVHVIVDNYATHKHARVQRWLAGGAAALSCALHSHLRLLAQPGRDLVPPYHPTRHPAGSVPQCEGAGGQDRSICGA